MASILRWTNFAFMLAVVPLFLGCAHVEPNQDYQRVNEHLQQTTDVEMGYTPGDLAVMERVDELQREGLTVDEAVQLCVLNNPTLQAEYASVGIARADVAQSGLFSNPSLAFSVQFPEGGGRSNIQASLAQNIVDLWQIPVRKRAAERSLDEAILRLARTASQLCIDTKVAYYAALAADESHSIAQENLHLTGSLLDVALAQQTAGIVGELDVNLNRQTVLGSQLEVQQTRLDASTARRRLAVLLGLIGFADDLALTTPLPTNTHLQASDELLFEIATEHRLDLRAAKKAAEAAGARVELEYRKIIPEFSLGGAMERNERRALGGRKLLADTALASVANRELTAPDIQTRGERDLERRQEIEAMFGPAFTLTLPIFDQNQAQIAKARFVYEQALKQVDALERAIVQEIRQSLDQLQTAADIVSFYEGSLLPQALSNLDLSRSSYEIGRTSVIIVLDAQRNLLTARRAAVTARQNAATAVAEVERTTAQPFRALGALSTPDSQPTTAPTDK
ncbi:MAG TPA: TolC family protein [Phycisphaerae bacterium]|nr:TolC family protein [Phycisphaerae bacterium]